MTTVTTVKTAQLRPSTTQGTGGLPSGVCNSEWKQKCETVTQTGDQCTANEDITSYIA